MTDHSSDPNIEAWAIAECLRDNAAIDTFAADLQASDFSDEIHQRAFHLILSLRADGAKATPAILQSHMRAELDEIEAGQDYFRIITAAAPVSGSSAEYASILKDLSRRRTLAGIGQALAEGAYKSPSLEPTQRLTDRAANALLSLGMNASRPPTRPGEIAVMVLDRARAALAGEKIPSIPTGYTKLDKAIGGMQSEDQIFIPGRSGMGKTSLWINIALHAARSGAPVLLFSKEMPDFQLTQWLLCCLDNALRDPTSEKAIHHWKFRVGCLSNFEIARLDRAQKILEGLQLEICDDKGLTLGGQMSRARAFARRYPGELGLIGLDFLQNLEDDQGRQNDSREQVVSRLAYGQKKLAGMLGWPNLVTVQLKNKFGVGMKRDALPTADDIRESGAIEMAGDIVFTPHRKAFFHKQNEPTVPHDHQEWVTWSEKMAEIEHDLWLRGFKNRHGDPSSLNIELWADMGAAAICNERPGRYHLPPSDEPIEEELRF